MTIKALNGGKLLCLMATVAGAMALGSCSKDDDEPAPAPAPVVNPDTTPKKVVYADEYYFRVNKLQPDTLNSGDTIKAKTLLENGLNSDTVSVDVILRNGVKADSTSTTFTFTNDNLGKLSISNASFKDSIYSVSFPAIEGNYTLNINNKSIKFVVAGEVASDYPNRNLSNALLANLDGKNKSFSGIEFVPAENITVAHLKGDGSFVSLDEESYNKYLTSAYSYVKADIEYITKTNSKNVLPLNDLKYFAFVANNGNILICNVENYVDGIEKVSIKIRY